MQSGWGAMGAGAWGGPASAPQPPAVDDDSPRAAVTTSAVVPKFGSSYPATQPVQPSFSKNTSAKFGDSAASAPSTSAPMSEAALRKREKELDERERRLREREQEAGLGQKNWPICSPFMRHSIAEDIPEKSRRVVREAYACWWGLMFALTYQFFCATVMLGSNASNKVPSWFLSIIFWVMGVPLSLWLWYMRLYNAAQNDSTVGFIAFLLFFFCHWAFCVFCAIGVQINAAQWCFSGFMAGIQAFDTGTFQGIVFMIGGGVWSVLALYSMWVLKDAWFFFRGQGGAREVAAKRKAEADREKNEQALATFRSAGANGNQNMV